MVETPKKKTNPLDNLFAINGKLASNINKSDKDSGGKRLVFRMKMGDVLEPHYFIRNKLSLTRRQANKLSFLGPNLIDKSNMQVPTSADYMTD